VADGLNFISDSEDRNLREGPISFACFTFSEPEPMVKGADKPETIHGEPYQREGTGKPGEAIGAASRAYLSQVLGSRGPDRGKFEKSTKATTTPMKSPQQPPS
jgi:hypothetical protein